MEVNKLSGIVVLFVIVGMLIGIGILTLEKFGAASYYSRYDYNDSVAATANATSIGLDYGNLTNVDAVWNNTYNVMAPSCYLVDKVNGSFRLNVQDNSTCGWDGGTVYVLYDYKEYSTSTRDSTSAISTEISNISTNWVALLITIIVLSIILFLVMRSFSGFGKR